MRLTSKCVTEAFLVTPAGQKYPVPIRMKELHAKIDKAVNPISETKEGEIALSIKIPFATVRDQFVFRLLYVNLHCKYLLKDIILSSCAKRHLLKKQVRRRLFRKTLYLVAAEYARKFLMKREEMRNHGISRRYKSC